MSAFYECKALASITIPTSVIVIGYSAFKGCTALISIILPSVAITAGAFRGCTALASIGLTSVTSIGEEAFFNCASLKLVVASRTTCTALLVNPNRWFNNCPKLIGGGLTLSTPKSRLQAMRLWFWSPSTHVDFTNDWKLFAMTVILVALRLGNCCDTRSSTCTCSSQVLSLPGF